MKNSLRSEGDNSGRNSAVTIVSMAVVAALVGSLLHEGLGHGVTAWLRGDMVTEWTSNHVNTIRDDRLVDAGGTVVNLIAGSLCLLASRMAGARANLRYFLWLLGAINLLDGAGYFLFSGVLGVGDWAEFIAGMPNQAVIRVGMSVLGLALYLFVIRMLAVTVSPFVVERQEYKTIGRLPYLAACIFMCMAGALDPMGLRLMVLSTVPAYFGGLSGLLWVDSRLPKTAPAVPLKVHPSYAWPIAAVLLGGAFLLTVARGFQFHP